MSFSWRGVARRLRALVAEEAAKSRDKQHLDDGQRASLTWMAEHIPQSGVVLADEVGTGKTRIACAVIHAVLEAGGRAAVVVPHGLMHQWSAESRALRAASPAPNMLTTLTEFLREESSNDLSPKPDKPEWWLVSHGFRAPVVYKTSNVWRMALPALVGLNLSSPEERTDGRTRIGRLQREIEDASAQQWGLVGMAQIAGQVTSCVRGRPSLRGRIGALPLLDVLNRNNDGLREQFGNSGDGRALTEDLLGLWLGEFDLLVIDEAHKSRGHGDIEDNGRGAPAPVLTRLVDGLLKQTETGRRLCLTATPMELDLSQWLGVLERARSGLDRDGGREVMERLRIAATSAAVAPDEGRRLDELCASARLFTARLAPYVTRRRRDDDPLVIRFRTGAGLPAGLPHPHRRLQRVPIEWIKTAGGVSPWMEVLLAAECMSQSIRGLTRRDTKAWPHALRDAYTKLAAGHVSVDLFEPCKRIPIPGPGDVDDHTRGKIARTAYWYRRLRDGLNGPASGLEPEHPRILAAVKEVESFTLKREKVLVFGVFLGPLRLLRDVLNVRHALRAADAGRPIAHAIHTDGALFEIALRQIERLRAEGALASRLSKANGGEMRQALADSHKAYKRQRDKVRERAEKQVRAWRRDAALLASVPIDDKRDRAIRDHLISFVLDGFLTMTSESDEITDENFDALTTEFAANHLRPLLGEEGNGGDNEDNGVPGQESLWTFLEDDPVLQSSHARLLQGDTRWQTRRYLQTAFNRLGGSPRVLIAQSQVGREGLNLHESCRVVIQFHAEWNPAVLEQQIGRVDRKGSLWERLAQKWLEEGRQGDPPFIEVRQLVFEGTYDAFQWDRVMRRQAVFDASLFGSLLPAEAWDRVPKDRLEELVAAAPSFRPVGSAS